MWVPTGHGWVKEALKGAAAGTGLALAARHIIKARVEGARGYVNVQVGRGVSPRNPCPMFTFGGGRNIRPVVYWITPGARDYMNCSEYRRWTRHAPGHFWDVVNCITNIIATGDPYGAGGFFGWRMYMSSSGTTTYASAFVNKEGHIFDAVPGHGKTWKECADAA